MATRFRLPSAGTAAVSPATQSYTHTGTTRRSLPTTTTGDASALTTTAITPDAADHLVAGDVFHVQFVSDVLLPSTSFLTGLSVKLAIQGLEAHTNNNLVLQIWVGVVFTDGTGSYGPLLAKTLDGLELNTVIQNRIFSATTTAAIATNPTFGGRLVVEISVSGTPGPATGGTQGHNASLRFGSNGAGGDLPEDDTSTGATLNPWFEIGQDGILPTPASVSAGVMVAPTAALPAATLTGAGAPGGAFDLTGLGGHWTLDESSGTRADSHGSSDLTPTNAPGNAAGQIGNALALTTGTQLVLCADNPAVSVDGTDFTLTAWLYLSSTGPGSDAYVISKWGAAGSEFLLYFVAGYIRLYVNPIGGNVDAYIGMAAPDTWQFMVAQFNNTSKIVSISINNSTFEVSGAGTGAVAASSAPFAIGATSDSASAGFYGRIDEVSLWKRLLTPAEITTLYNGGAGLAYPWGEAAPEDVTFVALAATADADAPVATVSTGPVVLPEGAAARYSAINMGSPWRGLMVLPEP